jgi:hypothetical protein
LPPGAAHCVENPHALSGIEEVRRQLRRGILYRERAVGVPGQFRHRSRPIHDHPQSPIIVDANCLPRERVDERGRVVTRD